VVLVIKAVHLATAVLFSLDRHQINVFNQDKITMVVMDIHHHLAHMEIAKETTETAETATHIKI